jgi:hypothetical protein
MDLFSFDLCHFLMLPNEVCVINWGSVGYWEMDKKKSNSYLNFEVLRS